MTPSPLLPRQCRHRVTPVVHAILWSILLGACHDTTAPDLQPWLAQMRSQARPQPLPEMALPAIPARWLPEPGTADPFGLQLKVQASLAAIPKNETSGPALAPVALPPIRAVAVLHRPGVARALLQIGGRMLQVAPGDALPGLPGRVLHIDERAVRLELAGREVRLDLGIGLGATKTNDAMPGAPA
ncbi:hypothetical protein [Herbaspirillum sp. alder98]|uniref:hypothetical protein n=1 Tax=Herbaspirillum sp. alder98 TaxID=2913096 RepID=UPI001CD8B285|nr:hypothetical protein [Herbaspirillum sp. alder98]MCA1324197.1 hypothetical protein [Herbaspirillum sp. alder98]